MFDLPPSLPPSQHELVQCSFVAAQEYQLPLNLFLAVAEAESGKPGQWNKNKNGTHDLGSMQFNTAYLKSLEKFGITKEDVLGEGCYPYRLAAWRIANHIQQDKGTIWQRAANYHSRTPKYNTIYRTKLMRLAIKWANWLTLNYRVEQK